MCQLSKNCNCHVSLRLNASTSQKIIIQWKSLIFFVPHFRKWNSYSIEILCIVKYFKPLLTYNESPQIQKMRILQSDESTDEKGKKRGKYSATTTDIVVPIFCRIGSQAVWKHTLSDESPPVCRLVTESGAVLGGRPHLLHHTTGPVLRRHGGICWGDFMFLSLKWFVFLLYFGLYIRNGRPFSV